MSIPPNGLRIGLWVVLVMDMPGAPTFGRSDAWFESSVGQCQHVDSTRRPEDRHVGVEGPGHTRGGHVWTV